MGWWALNWFFLPHYFLEAPFSRIGGAILAILSVDMILDAAHGLSEGAMSGLFGATLGGWLLIRVPSIPDDSWNDKGNKAKLKRFALIGLALGLACLMLGTVQWLSANTAALSNTIFALSITFGGLVGLTVLRIRAIRTA
jgi:hypothetical protein